MEICILLAMHSLHQGIILFLFFALLCCRNADAQSRKGDMELSANVGYVSGTQIGLFFTHLTEDSHFDNVASSMPVSANFRYYIRNKLAVGASLSYQWIDYQFTNTGQKITIQSYPLSGYVGTLAAEVKQLYLNRRFFQLYGLLGLGARVFSVQSATPSDEQPWVVAPNFQVTPVGFRIGDNFGLYGELGVGYRGVFSAGLFYHFHSHSEMMAEKREQLKK